MSFFLIDVKKKKKKKKKKSIHIQENLRLTDKVKGINVFPLLQGKEKK